MSNTKKTVRISENDLVDLIDNIVSEAVEIKKKEWLAEQVAKGEQVAIFESRVAELETKINKLTAGK